MTRRLYIPLIVIFFVVLPTVVVASGFDVGSFIFPVTVEEAIYCEPACNDTEVPFTLFPGETQELERRVFNRSSADLEVLFSINISTERDEDDLEVSIPDVFLVPGRGDTTQRIFIHAIERAEPGEYRVVIGVERGEY